jgi:hypothetical protein
MGLVGRTHLDGDGGIPAVIEDGLPNLGDFLFA